MPLSLIEVASNTATLTIPVGGDTLTITYYPSKVTEKVFAKLQRMSNPGPNQVLDGFTALNELLVLLIKSWDFYEDVEQTTMVPLDVERLADVPLFLRAQIISAITGDVRPETLAPQMMTLN